MLFNSTLYCSSHSCSLWNLDLESWTFPVCSWRTDFSIYCLIFIRTFCIRMFCTPITCFRIFQVPFFFNSAFGKVFGFILCMLGGFKGSFGILWKWTGSAMICSKFSSSYNFSNFRSWSSLCISSFGLCSFILDFSIRIPKMFDRPVFELLTDEKVYIDSKALKSF